jgi:hypothetical protein
VFTAYNGYQLWMKEKSCNCFGAVSIDPAYVLAFDVVTLAILWSWTPPDRTSLPVRNTPLGECVVPQPRRRLPYAGTALLVIGAVCVTAAFAARAALDDSIYRHVTLDRYRHDFGDVRQGTSLTSEFRLFNQLGSAIEITDVRSSCGCTTVNNILGQVVQPGRALAVVVSLNSGDTDGERASYLTIFFRDLRSKIAGYRMLYVGANVTTDYLVRPMLVDFGEVNTGHPVTRLIRLRPNRLKDVRILSIESNHPAVTARQVEGDLRDQDQHVEITFSAAKIPLHSGAISGTLWVLTNSELAPKTAVIVRAYYRPSCELVPQVIVIDSAVRGPIVREVSIRSSDAIKILNVSVTDPAINFQILPTDGGGTHGIRVELPDTEKGRAINADLKIQFRKDADTSTEEARTLSVAIHRLTRNTKGD